MTAGKTTLPNPIPASSEGKAEAVIINAMNRLNSDAAKVRSDKAAPSGSPKPLAG